MFDIFAPFIVDLYKTQHKFMMPNKTQEIYSNITPRNNKYFRHLPNSDGLMVFFGLQIFIENILIDQWNRTFFQRDKNEVILKYKKRMASVFGDENFDTTHLENLHDLGYLPLEIRALPEGTLVDMKVAAFTVRNTHEDFAWLTNYIETVLSCELWKPSVAASTALQFRTLFEEFAQETCDNKNHIPFQGHDFSMRGMSGYIDAAQSGVGHLTSFIGTDTLPSIEIADTVYNINGVCDSKRPIGTSVPATEHSIMCLGGEKTELGTYRRLITEAYPTGIVSIVSDTWNYWNVMTNYTRILKDDILARKPKGNQPGCTVFRPDSGDPLKIICGDKNADPSTPEYKGSLEVLWEVFGGSVNSKGYRVLNPAVGIIYGDAITLDRALSILAEMKKMGFASSNIVFGIGSFSYQLITRDTFSLAMKATNAIIDGKAVAMQKDPKTGDSEKKSARGYIRVERAENGHLVQYDEQKFEDSLGGLMERVFYNGKLYKKENLEIIRNRVDVLVENALNHKG